MKEKNRQKLKELEEKKKELEKEIKELRDEDIRERLKNTEKKYLGRCFENEKSIFKVVCAASSNEYRVSIIGVLKDPKMENNQDIFDCNFHRHPFEGQTSLEFIIEDDIMMRDLQYYDEITKEEFEKKLKEVMKKFENEMKKEFKLEHK